MNIFNNLNVSQKLLILSLVIELWNENGYDINNIKVFPSDVDFDNPLETSRIFYLESYYIENKEVPSIKYSIESSVMLDKKMEDIINNYNSLSGKEKLNILMSEIYSFSKDEDYKKLDIFKDKKILSKFDNIYNKIEKHLENV